MRPDELQRLISMFGKKDSWWVMIGENKLHEPMPLAKVQTLAAKVTWQSISVMHEDMGDQDPPLWFQFEPVSFQEVAESGGAGGGRAPVQGRRITDDQVTYLLQYGLYEESQVGRLTREEASSLIRAHMRRRRRWMVGMAAALLVALVLGSLGYWGYRARQRDRVSAMQVEAYTKGQEAVETFRRSLFVGMPLMDKIEEGYFSGRIRSGRIGGVIEWEPLKGLLDELPEVIALSDMRPDIRDAIAEMQKVFLARESPQAEKALVDAEWQALRQQLPPPEVSGHHVRGVYRLSPFSGKLLESPVLATGAAPMLEEVLPVYQRIVQRLQFADVGALDSVLWLVEADMASLRTQVATLVPDEARRAAVVRWLDHGLVPYLALLREFHDQAQRRMSPPEVRETHWARTRERLAPLLDRFLASYTTARTRVQEDGQFVLTDFGEAQLVVAVRIKGELLLFVPESSRAVRARVERLPGTEETRTLGESDLILRVSERIHLKGGTYLREYVVGGETKKLDCRLPERYYLVCTELNLNKAIIVQTSQWIYEQYPEKAILPRSLLERLEFVPRLQQPDIPEGFQPL